MAIDAISPARAPAALSAQPIRLTQAAGRWVVFATVLGSSVAMLDAAVVNVALPALAQDLSASMAGLQWIDLTGSALDDPAVFADGFRAAMLVSAVLLVLGAVISLVAVRKDALRTDYSWHAPLPSAVSRT